MKPAASNEALVQTVQDHTRSRKGDGSPDAAATTSTNTLQPGPMRDASLTSWGDSANGFS